MHHWISKMYYTLFDAIPELLNVNCITPSFKFHQVDEQFLFEMHLLIWSDNRNLSPQLICRVVCISDYPGGDFSVSIRWMDPKFHALVCSHVSCSTNLFLYSSICLSKFVGVCTSGISFFDPNLLQLLLRIMLESFVEKFGFDRCHLMDFAVQYLFCSRLISIWLFGCWLSGSNHVYQIFPSCCCCNLFSHIHLDLHCSTDCMNLLFL